MKSNIKKKIRHIVCDIIAMAVSCSCFAMPVVFANEPAAWVVDFETTSGKIELVKGSIYDTGDPGHGKVLKCVPGLAPANIWATDNRAGMLESKDYVFSFEFCAKQKNVGWTMQLWSETKKAFLCFTMNYDGRVGFIKDGGYIPPGPDPANFLATSYEANRWYTADVVIDVDGGIKYYIDGKYLDENQLPANFGRGQFFVALLNGKAEWVPTGTTVDPDTQALYMDNFKVTYTGDNSFYMTTKAETDGVSLSFSETPVTDLTQVEIRACDTGDKLDAEIEQSGKKLTITSAQLVSGKQYAVILPENVTSVSGNTLKDKLIYFSYGGAVSPSVENVVLTDIYGENYGPLSEMPITQTLLTVEFNGNVDSDVNTILSNITLSDEENQTVLLQNPKKNANKIEIEIAEFLKMSKRYKLTVESFGGMPAYEAVFYTNDEVIQGYFPVNIVKANGDSVHYVTEEEVFASTEIINTTNKADKAVITLAAYTEDGGKLKLISVKTKQIDIPSLSRVVIGPDAEETNRLKLTVTAEAELVKAFIWQLSENKSIPVAEAVMVNVYTPTTVQENSEGVFENENGEVSVVAKGLKAESDTAVFVTGLNTAYGDAVAFTDQLKTDEIGNLKACFDMNGCTSGDYTVTVIDADGKEKKYDFVYVSPTEFSSANGIANKLDSATDATDCATALADYAMLGISKELYDSVNINQTAEILFNKLRNEQIIVANGSWLDASKIAKQAFIMGAAANGKLENVFDYKDELVLEENENWEWYSKSYVRESVQKAMTTRLRGTYTTECDFYKLLEEGFVLSVVYDSDGVANVKEVLGEFAGDIGITSTGKDATYRDINGLYFENYSLLKAKFEEFEKRGTGGGSSAGGGGSSGGGATSGGTTGAGDFRTEYIGEISKQPEAEKIPDNIFEDLDGYSWAKQAIVYLAEQRIVTGRTDKKFCPSEPVTREEFAAMLVRAFVKNDESSDVIFKDAKSGEWYNQYLSKAVSAGIVTGYDDGRFGIGEKITRQDMVVMLSRAAEYAGIILDASDDDVSFVDDSSIADYAKTAVYAMKNAEIVNGVSAEYFSPLENAQRAQAAKVIFGLMNI